MNADDLGLKYLAREVKDAAALIEGGASDGRTVIFDLVEDIMDDMGLVKALYAHDHEIVNSANNLIFLAALISHRFLNYLLTGNISPVVKTMGGVSGLLTLLEERIRESEAKAG